MENLPIIFRLIFFPILSVSATRIAQSFPNQIIVGGDVETDTTYSFQAQIKQFDQHICGAVIIDPNWALTAAHCVYGRDISKLEIVLEGLMKRDGAHKKTPPSTKMTPTAVTIHPQYSATGMANDLALIRLPSSQLPSIVHPIKLPAGSGDKFTDKLSLIGYGSISARVAREQAQKRIVTLPIVALARCRAVYGQSIIDTGMLCAGGDQAGAGLCHGDAGSGLSQFDSTAQVEVLAGIASFGFDCGAARFPSVFTAVADYVDWIRSQTTGQIR